MYTICLNLHYAFFFFIYSVRLFSKMQVLEIGMHIVFKKYEKSRFCCSLAETK